LTAQIVDVLRATHTHGARTFLLIHGHIANVPVVFDAADQFCSEVGDSRVMAVSWWDLVSEATRDAIAADVAVARADDHHGALVETSLMMHISPQSVRRHLASDDHAERRVRYLILPVPDALRTRTGIVYRATGAKAEIGRRVLDEVVANLVDAVELELGAQRRNVRHRRAGTDQVSSPAPTHPSDRTDPAGLRLVGGRREV
jgi:creatinine amidohydrolase